MLEDIMNKYNLSSSEKKELKKMVSFYLNDSHFKLRASDKYTHHSKITLTEHIIEDAVLSYKMVKRKKRYKNVDINLVIDIAMMHDLYKLPWQNNSESNAKFFFNKHGFRHPIEAVSNAIKWFPSKFIDNDKSYVIIDSIIHHMWPLGVSRLKRVNINHLELKNYEALYNLNKKYQNMIIKSCNRCKIGCLSFAKPKYIEGKVVSKADRKVSIKQIDGIHSLLALVSGKNKSIRKK